jgi:NADPH-dependent curcumin reductase CurA
MNVPAASTTAMTNLVARIARLPGPGPLTADVYEYREEPLAPLADGEVRLEAIYATVDAGARGMVDADGSYPLILRVGSRVPASAVVGRVIESRHPGFGPGDFARTVLATRARYLTLDPARRPGVRRVDPAEGPLHMHVGALGMTGFTAWVGMLEIIRPLPGETVVVSAAAGAVGSVAGQLAKAGGARVVGIAGGPAKCARVVDELGFDACLDYKAGDLVRTLGETNPEGVVAYFDNVGGAVLRDVLAAMKPFGRVALCGQVSQYGADERSSAPNLMVAVNKRLRLTGYLSSDHMDRLELFERGVSALVRSGRLRPVATISPGLENTHAAVNALMTGQNFGQQVQQIGPDPTI